MASSALNGRGHAVPAHRYQALELSGSEPYPDTAAAYEDFVTRVVVRLEAARGEALASGELTELWTVYRLGRFDERLAAIGQRRVEETPAEDCSTHRLEHVVAEVESLDEPAAAGRRGR